MIMYIDSQRVIIVPYSQLGEDKEKVIALVKKKPINKKLPIGSFQRVEKVKL